MAPLQVHNFEKDVIYLFQFAGTETVSSLSPYCVKVEAFCRLHNLKFERRNTFTERGSNGLLPFIELNGVATCESEVIITRLTKDFNLKNYADKHSEGVGHALERMIENHTLQLLRIDSNRTLGELFRVILKERVPGFTVGAVSSLGASYMRRKARGGVKNVIGAFTAAEYDELLRSDLIQLQNVLGEKQFLMGDSPSKVDCLALGHIGHAYFRLPHARSYIHDLIDSSELSAFKAYLERVVKTLYDDKFNNKE